IYFNGIDVAHISATTSSFAPAAAALRLHAFIETNLEGHYDLTDDNFTLNSNASHVSNFTWTVPANVRAWDFSLHLALYEGAAQIAAVMLPKAAMGTYLTQSQIDAIVAQNTTSDCDPPVTDCATYLIGLVPGFGLATDLAGFQSDVCEMGRQRRLGNYWKAT